MKNRSSISYSSHEEAEFYSKVKTSLIQRVRTYIPPTNALDYVSQIIKFFAVSLKDLWRRNDTDNIRSFFQRSTRHMIDPKDILTLFLSNKDSPMVKDFCDLISEDPLHLFRGRYEITVTFFTISLRPLMPERYFCVTVIVWRRLTPISPAVISTSPLSFRFFPLSFPFSPCHFLFPPVISKRSEKCRVAEDALPGADDDCIRSLPLVEMTAGAGRDDKPGAALSWMLIHNCQL